MVNRKRYYNSFFDQINDYKQKTQGEGSKITRYVSDHVLGVGLVGALAIVFFSSSMSGSLGSSFVTTSGGLAYYRQESRPAFQFFNQLTKTDASFARELDGKTVWPSADAYTSVSTAQKSTAREEILQTGGSNKSRAFLRFDLSSLKSKDELILKLYPTAQFTGTVIVTLLPADELWEEDLLTNDSAPLATGKQVGKVQGSFSSTSSVDFDLKDALVDSNVVNFVVSASGSTTGFSFYARESSQPPIIVNVVQ